MTKSIGQRDVILALALCLPLILVHYFNWLDLGYFVYVPMITLAVIVLAAFASRASDSDGPSHG